MVWTFSCLARATPLAALALCAGLLLTATVEAATTDEDAARAVMMSTWDRPDARLTADPVVTHGDAALAAWTQGERGGRALLRKTAQGWQVTVCGGDGIKDARQLQMAGLDSVQARALVAALTAAEKRLPAAQVRKFSLFGKNVAVGPDHHAPAHGQDGHGKHGQSAAQVSGHSAHPAASAAAH